MGKRLPPNTITDPVAYLLGRTDRSGHCWMWTGPVQPAGYGVWPRSAARRYAVSTLAHRALYALVRGPIPAGLQLDHLCRNRACINPDHLEVVTNRTNVIRGRSFAAANAAKTHCPQGHPYDEANTYVLIERGKTRRCCRACNRAAKRCVVSPNIAPGEALVATRPSASPGSERVAS